MMVGWAIFYGTLSVVTLISAWRTDSRWIAIALVIECGVTNLIGFKAPPDSSPTVNALLDIGLMITASCVTISRPVLGVIIIILATLGCVLGLAYSANADPALLNHYEIRANALFILKCGVVLMTGLWDVAGHRAIRFVRWRSYRRNAANAARIRLARSERS